MVCHEARRLFCWEVEGSDELKENLVRWLCRTTIWSQHLWRYRPVFVKSVTPAQEAKTVVANGGGSLDIYSPTLASSPLVTPMCRVCGLRASLREPRFSVRTSGAQDPRRLIPSVCANIVCSAAAASAGSWSCVGKRVRSRIHVVVCSYCRCVWDRGRCAFPL